MPSPRAKLDRTLLLIGRLGLAVIFLLAAYGKLRPQEAVPWTLASLKITPSSLAISSTFFAMQIDSFQLLPDWAVTPFAHTLPWVEFAVGVLLLSGLGLRYVSILASLLIALFFGVVVRTYALHIAINCGCFGPNEKLGPWSIARDGLMLALAVAVTIGAFVIHRRAPSSLESAASNP
ncbi:MAG TPA: MauE/DoxX family redox-associated membrane protein [Candidatus Acidoferrales bacterium]|nr:MauE/DoxX family redox-associated membrane protein [Candidatus Acidoferrales bacterium]